jgi:DDE family transposase
MPHSTAQKRTHQIDRLRKQFAQFEGLTFAEVLPSQRLERVLQEEGAAWREETWTPLLTVWSFLGQVIAKDSEASCRKAVSRALAWLVSRGEPPCPAGTGPYCKARCRLPESLFSRLMRETGQALSRAMPAAWRWLGRPVKIADGTTVSMPDTSANQAVFPQAKTQQPGLGFPIARLVTVFCLGSGAVLDAALGPYCGKQTGENALLRTLAHTFQPGDVLLADRYFSGYFDMAFWQQRGVDVVVRLHQLRDCDLRRGRRLGANDHVVVWTKPRQRPEWLDEATYARMPDQLELREVRVRIQQPGCRAHEVVVVTTLLAPQQYSPRDLADLYRMRWHAELDLRSLKVTLGMDVLRCKAPDMVRKEVWAHLLAYNLIRTVMAQAADASGCAPRQLSFTGALQTMTAFAERLYDADRSTIDDLHAALLTAVAAHVVGNRPNRHEPRAIKRRPKPHRLLTQPRAVARRQLLART